MRYQNINVRLVKMLECIKGMTPFWKVINKKLDFTFKVNNIY